MQYQLVCRGSSNTFWVCVRMVRVHTPVVRVVVGGQPVGELVSLPLLGGF